MVLVVWVFLISWKYLKRLWFRKAMKKGKGILVLLHETIREESHKERRKAIRRSVLEMKNLLCSIPETITQKKIKKKKKFSTSLVL